MKAIFNILIILVVAVIVGGLFYGAVTVTSSGGGRASVQDRPQGGGFQPDRERSSGGVQIPVDMIKNLAIISIVAAGYLNAAKFFGREKIGAPMRA
jgi:hypothetical protein